jgi:hypothetical protein
MTVISKVFRQLVFRQLLLALLATPWAFLCFADNGLSTEQTFPKRKAGLWQVKAVGLEQAGMPPTLFCVGDATDSSSQHIDRKPGVLGSCTLGAFKQAQGGWLAESVCKDSKTTIKSQAVLTGDLNVEYRIDTVVTYLPPIAGTRKIDQDSLVAKLVGPCAANQKPGDLVVPGMGTLNLTDGTFKAELKPALKRSKGSQAAKKQR